MSGTLSNRASSHSNSYVAQNSAIQGMILTGVCKPVLCTQSDVCMNTNGNLPGNHCTTTVVVLETLWQQLLSASMLYFAYAPPQSKSYAFARVWYLHAHAVNIETPEAAAALCILDRLKL